MIAWLALKLQVTFPPEASCSRSHQRISQSAMSVNPSGEGVNQSSSLLQIAEIDILTDLDEALRFLFHDLRGGVNAVFKGGGILVHVVVRWQEICEVQE